jgi:ATP-binding protein involved in chromosome partitioning
MLIAIPIAAGKLAMHFGHCEHFALIELDQTKNEIVKEELTSPPPHQPGVLPPWLASQGVEMIIAGGMGSRARSLFVENNIEVVVGAPAEKPDVLVKAYIEGTLVTGDNVCDH